MKIFSYNFIHGSIHEIVAIKTEGRPTLVAPKHKLIEIPFRSGAYLLPDNSKPPIQISIECLFKSDRSIHEIARSLDGWLRTSNWKPLVFDDDPDYYFLALLTNAEPIADPQKTIMKFTFTCQPDLLPVEGNNNDQ